MKRASVLCLGILAAADWSMWAQSQTQYAGSNVTGRLSLSGTVNLLQEAQKPQPAVSDSVMARESLNGRRMRDGSPLTGSGERLPRVRSRRLPVSPAQRILRLAPREASTPTLPVSSSFSGFGFRGLTHLEQREANHGNQFSVEPPSQGLAVANGYILEGVNNAIQVYTTSGAPLLPKVLATNQVFGVAPAIDRGANDVNGVYPTDIRVFFDRDIQRWFIIQWAELNDEFGNSIYQSREWIAVSQTADPTASYNIYIMDTTNADRGGCPCVPDYPQVGADQYGFYVSYNDFNSYGDFIGSNVMAISKPSLAAGDSAPKAYNFQLELSTRFEFAIQPATTPLGASYYLANGGIEYFVSSQIGWGNSVALWAMVNTSSLTSAEPSPILIRTSISTLTYSAPVPAVQRPGTLTYGSSLTPPGQLSYIDGGDTRILSLSYSGGRLFFTLGTRVMDENGRYLAGGAYVILSPTYRNGVLSAATLRQGFLAVTGQNVIRPSVAVNAKGSGAIVFTLVGPSYFPSAAFVPIQVFSTGSTIQIAAAGAFPEDGFTGYPGGYDIGVARWGDYSAATVGTDGAIWMGTEYIPNAPRTEYANWGTFVFRYVP